MNSGSEPGGFSVGSCPDSQQICGRPKQEQSAEGEKKEMKGPNSPKRESTKPNGVTDYSPNPKFIQQPMFQFPKKSQTDNNFSITRTATTSTATNQMEVATGGKANWDKSIKANNAKEDAGVKKKFPNSTNVNPNALLRNMLGPEMNPLSVGGRSRGQSSMKGLNRNEGPSGPLWIDTQSNQANTLKTSFKESECVTVGGNLVIRETEASSISSIYIPSIHRHLVINYLLSKFTFDLLTECQMDDALLQATITIDMSPIFH